MGLYFSYIPGFGSSYGDEPLTSAAGHARENAWSQIWTQRPLRRGDPKARHVATWDAAARRFVFVDPTRAERAALA